MESLARSEETPPRARDSAGVPSEAQTESGRLRAGVRWLVLASTATRLLQLLVTFVIADLIGRGAFGVLNLANAALLFFGAIRRAGFGQAFVRMQLGGPAEEARAAATASTLLVTTNGLLCVIGWVAAPSIAAFYAEPLSTETRGADP